MPKQTQTKKQTKARQTEEIADQPKPRDTDQLKADLDAILDDIDEVLVENEAEAFVNSYQQRGGE